MVRLMNPENEKQRILVVDDIPANIKLICESLKDAYELVVAVDGPRALELARSEHPPDLVLLDVVMPGMDGHEVCKRLKQAPETRDIPVVFLTAKDQLEDEKHGLELGAVDYITKPVSLPILKVRVKNHLELKRQRDLLKQLAMVDALTQLPNRRRFDERLGLEWERGMRHGHSLAILFADIDHFKIFNDTYGHPKGDDCLRLVAKELEAGLKRSVDFIARCGGEEFVALLPDTNLEGARNVAENMRRKVRGLNIPHPTNPTGCVTISMGVAATVPGPGKQALELLRAADQALYDAKNKGRNQIVICTDDNASEYTCQMLD